MLSNILLQLGAEALIAAVVTFLITNFLPPRPRMIASALIEALSDGKLTESEVKDLRAAITKKDAA